jgi:hypothetical protein
MTIAHNTGIADPRRNETCVDCCHPPTC